MKKIIIIALLFLVRFTVFSQTTWDIQEINPSIEQSPFLSPTEIINSWDGAFIKPNLNLRMLNILINIIYDVTPDKDPYKNVPDSLIQWPHAVQEGINNEDTKPEWFEDLFDIEEEEEGNIHGMFTKKYYESSFGNLHLTGDFIVVDIRQSYIIAELQVQDGTFSADNLIKRTIKYINDNGGLRTIYGHDDISDYSQPDGDEEIHFGIVIFRNSKQGYGDFAAGTGITGVIKYPILFNDDNYYPLRALILFCSGPFKSWVLNPVSVMNHEMGHALFGSNDMHCGGGNGWIKNSGRVFLQLMGGYGLMGQSGTGLVSVNAFDRWWLHWKSPIYNTTDSYIAAGNQVSDISIEDGNKTFTLRDFVTTGDAIRIKLPYVDEGAKNQYIWLENHKIGTNGKIDFLTYSNTYDCRPQGKPGIYAYYQVGKDILTGEHNVVRPSGQSDHLKPISAEGNYNYSKPNPALKYVECVAGGSMSRAKKNDPNPFMGTNDLMAQFTNIWGNDLKVSDAFAAYSKNHYINGEWIDDDSLPFLMDERDPFSGECFFNLSTNPAPVPTTTYYNIVSEDGVIGRENINITDNNTIYLSGLSIYMKPIENGDYRVSIDWQRNTIENDVVWTGKIILTERLFVSNGSVVELKQNLTPCQITKDNFSNQYAPITEFFCNENSLMAYSGQSKLDVSEKSKIHILSSSVATFEDDATLTIKAGSELIVESCANLVFKGQAKLIVEPGGILTIKQGGNVFIDDINNIDLQNGFLIGNGGININMNNALVILGVPPSKSITTNTNWTNVNYKFYDNLYIAPGATLTLSNSELKFFRSAKVTVARGAKLEMTNNSNLTTTCKSELWVGVEVWGNPSLPQTPSTNQGHIIINNSKIELARTGVLLDKPMYPTDNLETPGVSFGNGGGIIQAINANFINNYIGVNFSPYIISIANELVNNASYFQNCTFTCNHSFPMADKAIDSHCNLNGVIGVDFKKCNFLASSEGIGINIKVNYGIRAHNSYFLVDGIIHNRKYQRSVFERLKYGVYATGSLTNRNFTVRNSVFKSCNTGVFASGINGSRITENLFLQPLSKDDNKFTEFGIFLEYCHNYTIQEDTLTCIDNHARSEAGILIRNSGPAENLVYNNVLWNFFAGIISEGENRGPFGTGLCIKCNEFSANMTDILLLPWGGIPYTSQGIKRNQGSAENIVTAPAGNWFTNPTNPYIININNALTQTIEYFYHRYPDNHMLRPDDDRVVIFGNTVLLSPGTPIPYSKEDACPSKLNNKQSNEELITSSMSTISEISETELLLNTLIDDGDTPLMVNSITSASPFEALSLHDELLNSSPYLSDTALIEAGKKEEVLNSALVRDIMVANPHSAKSPEVIAALEQRVEQLPEELMDEIMAGIEQISARQRLELIKSDRMADLAASRSELLHAYQVEHNFDSLRWALDQFPEPLSAYQKAWTWFDEGNIGDGLTAIQNLDIETVPVHHRSNQPGYVMLAGILVQMATDSSYVLSEDTITIEALLTLASNSNSASASARNLLSAYRIITYEPSIALPDTSLKSSFVVSKPKTKGKSSQAMLHVFPNPANEYVVIAYKLDNRGELTIVSQDGRIVHSQIINPGQNQVVVRVNYLTSGIYIARMVEGKKVHSTKFTVK